MKEFFYDFGNEAVRDFLHQSSPGNPAYRLPARFGQLFETSIRITASYHVD
jgi:hypothetical protein